MKRPKRKPVAPVCVMTKKKAENTLCLSGKDRRKYIDALVKEVGHTGLVLGQSFETHISGDAREHRESAYDTLWAMLVATEEQRAAALESVGVNHANTTRE